MHFLKKKKKKKKKKRGACHKLVAMVTSKAMNNKGPNEISQINCSDAQILQKRVVIELQQSRRGKNSSLPIPPTRGLGDKQCSRGQIGDERMGRKNLRPTERRISGRVSLQARIILAPDWTGRYFCIFCSIARSIVCQVCFVCSCEKLDMLHLRYR